MNTGWYVLHLDSAGSLAVERFTHADEAFRTLQQHRQDGYANGMFNQDGESLHAMALRADRIMYR